MSGPDLAGTRAALYGLLSGPDLAGTRVALYGLLSGPDLAGTRVALYGLLSGPDLAGTRVALYGLLSGPDLAGTRNTRGIRHMSLDLTWLTIKELEKLCCPMFDIDGFYAIPLPNEAYSSFGKTIEKEGVCSINPVVDWSVSGVDSAHARLQLAVNCFTAHLIQNPHYNIWLFLWNACVPVLRIFYYI